METIHHSAVSGYRWNQKDEPQEEQEYRPFSGYGRNASKFYPVCLPWRGNSIIPHHAAVESRDQGIANGRVFWGPTPEEVLARRQKAARQLEQPNAAQHRPFRWDARHSAVDSGRGVVLNHDLKMPDLSMYASPVAKRPQPVAQPVSSHVNGLTAALADRRANGKEKALAYSR